MIYMINDETQRKKKGDERKGRCINIIILYVKKILGKAFSLYIFLFFIRFPSDHHHL